jgi:hypothetical protein
MVMPPGEGIFYREWQAYASLNWCYHLHQGLIDDDVVNMLSVDSLIRFLQDFASRSFDFWINTLMSNGHEKTLNNLDSLLSVLDVSVMFTFLTPNNRTNSLQQLPNFPQDLRRTLENIQKHCKV